MPYTPMSKEKTKQANFRLPESLLDDLQKLAEQTPHSQTDIVTKGVRQQVRRLKAKHKISVGVSV